MRVKKSTYRKVCTYRKALLETRMWLQELMGLEFFYVIENVELKK